MNNYYDVTIPLSQFSNKNTKEDINLSNKKIKHFNDIVEDLNLSESSSVNTRYIRILAFNTIMNKEGVEGIHNLIESFKEAFPSWNIPVLLHRDACQFILNKLGE